MCVCAQKKRESVTKLVEAILKRGSLTFSKADFATIARQVLWLVDERSHDSWFRILWDQGFFEQPQFGVYRLRVEKLGLLDLKAPGLEQKELDVGGKESV